MAEKLVAWREPVGNTTEESTVMVKVSGEGRRRQEVRKVDRAPFANGGNDSKESRG